MASEDWPLGEEEPEGKNSPDAAGQTSAYISQRFVFHPGQRIAEEKGVGAQTNGIKESKDMHTYIAGNITNSLGAIWIFTAN